MVFVWNLSEKEWKDYFNYLRECEYNVKTEDDFVNTIGVIGSCNVGELCFDIRGWGDRTEHALGYELYVYGVDNGYNELLDGTPYDEVGYGEFGNLDDYYAMPLDEFKVIAEERFRQFITDMNDKYSNADLVAKANADIKMF